MLTVSVWGWCWWCWWWWCRWWRFWWWRWRWWQWPRADAALTAQSLLDGSWPVGFMFIITTLLRMLWRISIRFWENIWKRWNWFWENIWRRWSKYYNQEDLKEIYKRNCCTCAVCFAPNKNPISLGIGLLPHMEEIGRYNLGEKVPDWEALYWFL